LTNESHIVTTDSNGQNFDLTDAGGQFKVFYGNDDVTGEAILSIVNGTPPQNNNGIWTKADIADGNPTGLVLQLTESSGVYSLIVGQGETWDGDSATFTMQAFYEAANITVKKTYTITKSKAGTDGTPAKSIRLSSTSQTFKKKKVNKGTTESPDYEESFFPLSQEIDFTANLQNTTQKTATWSLYWFDTSWQPLDIDSNFLTVAGNTAKMNQTQFGNSIGIWPAVKVRATVDSVLFDEITIISVVDGVDGLPGSAGSNARSVKLTSTSYIINYNSAGKSADPQTITLTASPSSTITGTKTYSFTEGTGTSAIFGTSLEQNTATATVSFSTINHFTAPKLYKVTVYENDVEVANDSIVIAAVKEGSSARTVILSNEAHTVPELPGDTIDYTGSGTKIQVFVGATPLTFVNSATLTNEKFIVTTTPTGITVGSVDSNSYNSQIAIFKDHIDITADTATVDYVITGKDSEGTEFTITKTQTITRSKKGNDGQNAKFLSLVSDSDNFVIDSEGNAINQEIVFSTIRQNLTNYPSFTVVPNVDYNFDGYEDTEIVEEKTDFTNLSPWSALITGILGGNELTAVDGSGWAIISTSINNNNYEFFSFDVKAATGYLTSTYVKINDVFQPIYDQSGNSQPFTYSSNKTNYETLTVFLTDFIGSNFEIKFGILINDPYKTIADNFKFGIFTNPTILRLPYSSFGTNQEIKVTATVYEDGETYTSEKTVRKLESGTSGQDAKTVKLESDDYQVAYDASGENPETNAGNNFITLTATEQNHESVNYKFYKKAEGDTDFGEIAQDTGDTTNTRKFNLPETKFNKPIRFKVETREGSVNTVIATDSITVIATKDGESAFNIAIENDNHSFPAALNGTITNNDYALGLTDIEVYYGNTQLIAVDKPTNGGSDLQPNEFYVEKADSGITSTLQKKSDSTAYEITSLSSMGGDSATVTLTITARGSSGGFVSFVRYLSYSKSKKGDTGVDGVDGVDGEDGFDDRIYNFSKINDDNGILRPYGWFAYDDSDAKYVDLYKTYTGNFFGESSDNGVAKNAITVVSNADSKSGGNVLKWNYNTTNRWYVISDLIPIEVEKTYEFSTRAKRVSGNNTTNLRAYVIFYDEEQKWINRNRYFQLQGNSSSTSWIEDKQVLVGTGSNNEDNFLVSSDPTMPATAKYARLLLYIDFNGSNSSNTVYFDYCYFKEATPNYTLDENGRTPEANSSTNKPKILRPGDSPPSNPVEGDIIVISGNKRFAGKQYIYAKKEYRFYELLNEDNNDSFSNRSGGFANFGNAKIPEWDNTMKTLIDIGSMDSALIASPGSDLGIVPYVHNLFVQTTGFNTVTTYYTNNALFIYNKRSVDTQDYFYGKSKLTIKYVVATTRTDITGDEIWDTYNYNPTSYQDDRTPWFRVNRRYEDGTYTRYLGSGTSGGQTSDRAGHNDSYFTDEDGYRVKQYSWTADENAFYKWSVKQNARRNSELAHDHAILFHSFIVEGWVPFVNEDVAYKLREIEGELTSFNFSFTGQHKCVSEISSSQIDTGMIVSSVGRYDNVNYQNSDNENKILPIEAIPVIKMTTKPKDKSIIGVIADKYVDDKNSKIFSSDGLNGNKKIRYRVNSLGEGGIWVTNYNGNLENGDYITSSPIPGHGMKQDDDILRNYTVAKITCECDFDLESEIYDCEEFEWNGQIYRKAFVGCTYHCG
jgi:hypothetical protein